MPLPYRNGFCSMATRQQLWSKNRLSVFFDHNCINFLLNYFNNSKHFSNFAVLYIKKLIN